MTESKRKILYGDGQRYDLVMGAYAPAEMLDFYRRQITRYGEPILELACGSGRLLIPLTKAGIDVTGLDISRQMLDLAEQKAAAQQVELSLAQADIRDFELGRKFKTIFCPAQSIQHLLRREEIETGLACVRRHLASQGRFVIEIFNPSLLLLLREKDQRYLVGRYSKLDQQGDVIVSETVQYDTATQINHIAWHFVDEITGAEETLSFEMRQFYPQEMDALLEYNGFVIEQKYGDYSETVFSSASPKQLFVCRERN